MERIAVQAVKLLGPDNKLGKPEGGIQICRAILTIDEDGKVVGVQSDQTGYIEHSV